MITPPQVWMRDPLPRTPAHRVRCTTDTEMGPVYELVCPGAMRGGHVLSARAAAVLPAFPCRCCFPPSREDSGVITRVGRAECEDAVIS